MIDLTEHIDGCVKAHGRDKILLILWKLETFKRLWGKNWVHYSVEYRNLSCEVTEPEAWVCVEYRDQNYFHKEEVMEALKPDTSLFDCFQLFP
jgi:hypothetical protein